MKSEPCFIPSGGVTSPAGFKAGAAAARIKHTNQKRLDIGVIVSTTPCNAAAVFTTNKFKAAPVLLDMKILKSGKARAVVANSGCANACTGAQGMADAFEMAELTASLTGLKPQDVLVASTGVIGVNLPMERIRKAIPKIKLSVPGGHDVARAIMTTDTVPKEAAVKAGSFIIGGVSKGAGMIAPDMATLLCFLTTDADVELSFLKAALRRAVDISFNMISIDGDGSTNDTVAILANGKSGGAVIDKDSPRAALFQDALNKICVFLARAHARDGEGATRLIEVTVEGAASQSDARIVARTIVSSSLVKTAVHGCDPNWGRVVAAAGRSGAALDPDKVGLQIGGTILVKAGAPVAFDRAKVSKALGKKEVTIVLNLNLGRGKATAWGCDLSAEYVKINAEYTT
ncbi:MAG TPA: bifunctional glutamate N-acetyltransferase/amino-acid acetyltransferase ArgJ [Dehalococcoidales bacterium]|nr:bifunctional glutamate N-acetyltransferase/amino-acid acetyltransferase ArgJ [Dehalococcoidales bacterium]